MRTQVGAVVFDDSTGHVDGNYTHFVLNPNDAFVGATPRVGEFLVFCPRVTRTTRSSGNS